MKSVSAQEARNRFAEITDRVHYTGEPVVVEKQGKPFVALVSFEDLDEVQRLRVEKRQKEFARLAQRAARSVAGPEQTEEEIVAAVKRTRAKLYRERYGAG